MKVPLDVPQQLVRVAPTLREYTVAVTAVSVDGEFPVLDAARRPIDLVLVSDASWARQRAQVVAVRQALEAFERTLPALGLVASTQLHSDLESAATWARLHHDVARAPLETFIRVVLLRTWRRFVAKHGMRRLWIELRDELQREAASYDSIVRCTYLEWWRRRIGRLQRAFSWHVPGLAAEDVVGELLLALIRAVDLGNPAPFMHGGPGVEGTFTFLVREKNRLRRRRQIHEVTLREVPRDLHERTPSGEDLIIAMERRDEVRQVFARAWHRLSRTQRRYYEAVLEDAREHGYVSEVRIAGALGVHKSSVSRALSAICGALRASGAGSLFDDHRHDRARERPRATRRRWREQDGGEEVEHADLRRRKLEFAWGPYAHRGPMWPQPPWLDEGDHVRVAATGEGGIVLGSECYLVGVVYRVRQDRGQVTELPRDALIWLPKCPF